MSEFITGVIGGPRGEKRRDQLRRGGPDPRTFKMIFKRKDYEIRRLRRSKELDDLYRDMVRSGVAPLIIDCGANIGLASLYFDARFPGSQIVAIEPEVGNVELLRRNCQGVDNIHVELAAIASAPGFVRIVDQAADHDSYRTELIGDGQAGVPAITVEQLIDRYCAGGSAAPFIIKIDIEGAEEELFSANTEWVARFPLLIIELHDWMFTSQANSRNFLKCMAMEDRDFVYFDENIFSIRNTPGR